MRNWSIIVLQGVIRAVDQGKGSHQQAQPLPEVRVFYLAYLQKPIYSPCEWGVGKLRYGGEVNEILGHGDWGSHESGEDEA